MVSRYENFAKGKSITVERRKLAQLNENMKFKGGPSDRNYARKAGKSAHFRRLSNSENQNNEHQKANQLPSKKESSNSVAGKGKN